MTITLPSVTPLRALALGLAFLAGVAVTVASTINHQDFHEAHGTLPDRGFAEVAPGMFYEMGQQVGRQPLCYLEDYAENLSPVERHRRYYNVLGEAVPALARVHRWAGLADADGAPTFLEFAFEEVGLRAGFHADPAPDCLSEAEVAARRGSLICVVEQVFYDGATGAPMAVRFKEYAFTAAGASSFPRCPLAERPVSLASLKRRLIAFADL